MSMNTFYPVFETGQVLTSEQLNDIINYLLPQDRVSRSALSGIGIVCGLRPELLSDGVTLEISRGVAITSQGHLIVEDAMTCDRARPYTLPVPTSPMATGAQPGEARYEFMFDKTTGKQHGLFELLTTGFSPAPGEAPSQPLSKAFLKDKTLLLFLEQNLESLKNCDVNDCSDKGAEMSLTLRRLLISHTVADAFLNAEHTLTDSWVDRANHPRLDLYPVMMPKVNVSKMCKDLKDLDAPGVPIGNLSQLYLRYLECIAETTDVRQSRKGVRTSMMEAWNAYTPLLKALYPNDLFPDGPVPDYWLFNMSAALAENPLLMPYLYAALHDITLSLNEFIECASQFDAECSPNPMRFPRHVLAGDIISRPSAFVGAPRTFDEYQQYDPLKAKSGWEPESVPASRRHHFIPSPLLDDAIDQLAKLRSLYSRTLLLAQTYYVRSLMLHAPLGLTPSRDQAAELGERAIPFYYLFEKDSDLFNNWSWRKSRSHQLDSIQAHAFSTTSQDHPFKWRQDDQDFIRVEGILGKPLGSTFRQLVQMKELRGVSFAIELVWVGSSSNSDSHKSEKERARTGVAPLLKCRTAERNNDFLKDMSSLFGSAGWLVQTLGRLDATKVVKRPDVSVVAAPTSPLAQHLTLPPPFLTVDPLAQQRTRALNDWALKSARMDLGMPHDVVKVLAQDAAGEQGLSNHSVASLYDKVRVKDTGGELYDRVRAISTTVEGTTDPTAMSNTLYPSIVLLARAEELMNVTSVASIDAFDEQAFDTAVRGFSDAYITYTGLAETDPEKTDRDTANTNLSIIAGRDKVIADAVRLASTSSLQAQNQTLNELFESLTLPVFARHHPDMEHKGGVPRGGTLVLLYTETQTLLDETESILLNQLNRWLDQTFKALCNTVLPTLDIGQIKQELHRSAEPQNRSSTDNFVIVGDFCLPEACCDGQCSEDEPPQQIQSGTPIAVPPRTPVEPAEPARPTEPAPGGSLGKILVSVFSGANSDTEEVVKKSLLTITNLANGEISEQRLKNASTSLVLKASKYSFMATTDVGRSPEVKINVKADAETQVKLLIP